MLLDPLLASQPAALLPSREQMAFSLAYHIIQAQATERADRLFGLGRAKPFRMC
jgi:hypothetical protein